MQGKVLLQKMLVVLLLIIIFATECLNMNASFLVLVFEMRRRVEDKGEKNEKYIN